MFGFLITIKNQTFLFKKTKNLKTYNIITYIDFESRSSMEKNNVSIKMKPFIKWAGGKSQVLDIINFLKPKEINNFIEPFVGGGAVFLNFAHDKVIINDINKELMITYEVIRDSHKELINILNEWNNSKNLKEFYQEIRDKNISSFNKNEIAARLIFLNKYGFNGLYRVNSKGQFNVPFAKKNKINLYDDLNIATISSYLESNKIKIFSKDYKKLLRYIKPGDFLFVDPPYYFSDKKGFNAYDASRFTKKDQKNLFLFLKKVDKKGANWLLTNNDDSFIRDLYKNFFIFSIKTNRFINCNGKNRVNAADELFILNYKNILKEKKQMLPEQVQKELEFEQFLDAMISSNIKLYDYVDWNKVNSKVLNYQYDLSVFDNLHSKTESELKDKIHKYWFDNLGSFKKFYILLAGRESNSFLLKKNSYSFKDYEFKNTNDVMVFLKESNLINLFIGNKKIDFNSYFQGIEVGLDSNARKNRSGKIMENNIAYILEKNNIEFERNFPVDIIKDAKGNKKYFDFKFSKNNKTYYLECNFFNSSGSKINEVAKSYNLINKIMKEKGMNFVWVTDGAGWKKTKSTLRTVFFEIENLFSIELFQNWVSS